MAKSLSANSFYGASLPRPFLLGESFVDFGLRIKSFSNPASRESRPAGPNSFLVEWAADVPYARGGFAKSSQKRYKGSLKVSRGAKHDKPKRAPSAYLMFAGEERAEITKANPSLAKSIVEVSKEISKRWKEVAPERKLRLEAEAAELKKEYKEKVSQWKTEREALGALSSLTSAALKKGKKTRKGKKTTKGKKKSEKKTAKSLLSKMREKVSKTKKRKKLQVLTTPSNRRVLRERNPNSPQNVNVSTPQLQVMQKSEKNVTTPPPAPQKAKKSSSKKRTASKPKRSLRMKGRFGDMLSM
jgi:structure-specific recognition protein 1